MRSILRYVVAVGLILPVLKDGVERAETMSCQETDGGNQTSDTSCSEGSSREARQNDFIALFVVLRDSVSKPLGRTAP